MTKKALYSEIKVQICMDEDRVPYFENNPLRFAINDLEDIILKAVHDRLDAFKDRIEIKVKFK